MRTAFIPAGYTAVAAKFQLVIEFKADGHNRTAVRKFEIEFVFVTHDIT
jgi:hypothetical protein